MAEFNKVGTIDTRKVKQVDIFEWEAGGMGGLLIIDTTNEKLLACTGVSSPDILPLEVITELYNAGISYD